MMISYKITCASGVLVYGGSPDFLICVATAKEVKHEWSRRLPHSTLRTQFIYPNNKRVPSEDIQTALRALNDPAISAAVDVRRLAAQIPPARSKARTAGILADDGVAFSLAVDVDLCQAGVVAPPDSLMHEIRQLSSSPASKG